MAQAPRLSSAFIRALTRPQTARKTIRRRGVEDAQINLNNRANVLQEYANFRPHHRRRRRRRQRQNIRKSQQCISDTLRLRQCRKRTVHTHKCWIHLAKENNLRIKPSNIANAGKGLFAWKKSIPHGKRITAFTGRYTTKRALNRKYGNNLAEYALCEGNNCVDANYSTDSAARFTNDYRFSGYRQNSKYKKGKKQAI